MSDGNNSSGGIGVLGLLGVLFVGLKLTDVIDWSWWYVTMPFWAGLALVAVFMVAAGAIFLMTELYKKLTDK